MIKNVINQLGRHDLPRILGVYCLQGSQKAMQHFIA